MTEQDPYPPFCQRCMDSHPKGGECIAELEERVVEAAIAYRQGWLEISGGTWSNLVRNQLEDNAQMLYAAMAHAVDALISARERVKLEFETSVRT